MKKYMPAILIAMVLSLTYMTGCSQTASVSSGAKLASGGVPVMSVNPEIAVEYDKNGLVTGVTARNDDAFPDEVISDTRGIVNTNAWNLPTAVLNGSDYEITDYIDIDYKPDNDGVTDYDSSDYDN